MQRKAVLYDKGGDQHYDYISAWIKSTRGSDPDASLYYLAAMLEGGEDPRFIARRMVILASEDIGNADPQALADRRRGGARGRARRACRRRSTRSPRRRSTSRWRRSPTPPSRRSRAARAHIREHGAAAPPAALRSAAYPRRGEARPRDRLRLPARPPGPRERPGAPARGARGPALLRAGRPEAELRERLERLRRARERG